MAYSLTSKGQVTIPKEIRNALGLKERDKVAFIRKGDEVIIKPIKGNILELRGVVKPKEKSENFEEIRKITKKKISQRIVKNG